MIHRRQWRLTFTSRRKRATCFERLCSEHDLSVLQVLGERPWQGEEASLNIIQGLKIKKVFIEYRPQLTEAVLKIHRC